LFAGTNSHDRRLGAEAVVRTLVESGAVGLTTTHDLALTHIVELLGGRAANVHFEDNFEAGGSVTFDYRMRSGVVQRSNALALVPRLRLGRQRFGRWRQFGRVGLGGRKVIVPRFAMAGLVRRQVGGLTLEPDRLLQRGGGLGRSGRRCGRLWLFLLRPATAA